jgi:hypothetical protein
VRVLPILVIAFALCVSAAGTARAQSGGSDAPAPGGDCALQPTSGFGVVFATQSDAYDLLGCPTSAETGLDVVVQHFEHGWMIWHAQLDTAPATIYTLFDDNQQYSRFDDTYLAAVDPLKGPFVPPAGLFQPSGGFGKIWREGSIAGVRDRLGWASAPETPGPGAIEPFERGVMLFSPDPRKIFVLAANTSDRPPQVLQVWRAYDN